MGSFRQRSVQSVKQLHSLGIFHGDLEPQNVAETLVGFKFFDFGRSELHHCQQGQCGELQDFVERTELPYMLLYHDSIVSLLSTSLPMA